MFISDADKIVDKVQTLRWLAGSKSFAELLLWIQVTGSACVQCALSYLFEVSPLFFLSKFQSHFRYQTLIATILVQKSKVDNINRRSSMIE